MSEDKQYPAHQMQPAVQIFGVDLAKDGTEKHCEGFWKDGVLHITNVRTIPPQERRVNHD